MSNIPEAVHAVRREGNSLKARFFLWKDRVTRGRSISEMFPDSEWLKNADKMFEEGQEARESMDTLQDHPEDAVAYEKAVSSFRKLAAKVKALGGDIDPDLPE